MADLQQVKRIVNPIADDRWAYVNPGGARVTSRLSIGQPRRWPRDRQGDWICPVSIEHFTDGVTSVAGVGPVDALMNAMALVKAFAEQVGQFTPRGSEAQQGRKRPPRAGRAKTPRSAKKTGGRPNTHMPRRKRSTV